MKLPWTAGKPLSSRDWKSYQKRVLLECRQCDIRPDEYYLLARFPLLMEPKEWQTVTYLAKKLADEALAAEQELILRPELHESLGLPVAVRKVLRECGQRGSPRGSARVMRSDFHFTREGWRVSEVNTDYLGGYIEASSFTELMAPYYPEFSPPPNPASAYAKAINKAVGENALIAIVRRSSSSRYRDIKYVAREIRKRGMRTVTLRPGQIKWGAHLAKCANSSSNCAPDLLIRWLSADILHTLLPVSLWKPWFCGGRTPMSSPGSCIVTNSKRFPLVWDEMRTPMSTWRSLLPETRCPEGLLAAPEEEWVFKSFYGTSGREVAIAGLTEKQAYRAMLKRVKRHPHGWVAQRRFESLALPTEIGPRHVCLGIYTVDGNPVGAFARMAPQPLVDEYAEYVAVLIRDANGTKANSIGFSN